ncbi:unnamed protein product [Effrenium voratum]|nr:unnamed protein product [Effrenium voratum]
MTMIMAVPPTKPEEILQFSGRSPDVRRLLALAWQLRDFGLATKPRAESAGNFPQPPAACYPNLAGVRPQRTNEKDRRYTMGESLGGDVFGHAIGWAAARLSGAIEGVLGEEKRSDESRMNGRRSSDPIPRRPPKLSTPPSPLPGPPSRQTSFPVERETPPMSKLPSDAGDYGEASAQAPAAPVPIGRKPRDRGDTDSSWVLSPALSEISSVSQSQPRFNSLFSAAPAARAEHGVSEVQANARLRPGSEPVRNLLPFPRASRSEPEPSQAAERAGYQSEPFWAPLPEQEVRHAPAAESEPSASGIVKELDALQLMLNSLGKSQLLEGST